MKGIAHIEAFLASNPSVDLIESDLWNLKLQ